MINITATVKYYCRDAFFNSPFSNEFANQFSCFSIAAFDILSLDFLVQRAGGNQGNTVDIINDLCIMERLRKTFKRGRSAVPLMFLRKRQ